MHPFPLHRSPFDYSEAGKQDNPYRLIQKRLGLIEEAFEARIQEDIDEFFNEMEEAKALDREPQRSQAEASTSYADSSSTVTERIISKDECYRMLSDKVLTSGSMLGMYKWAANLGTARYNFEMEWTPENISLLNAYDC